MYADAEEPTGQASARTTADEYWQTLAQARTAEQLCRAWLPILCGMLPGLQAGLLLLEDADGSYAPAAVWPQKVDPSYLEEVATEALKKRQGVVHRESGSEARIAYPLVVGEQLYGAVVLDHHVVDEDAVTHAMRITHWGAGWLVDLFNRRQLGQYEQRLERSAFLLELALAALEEEDFKKAALVVVNRLTQRFGCHQVLMGLERGKTVRVVAVSHSAWFEEKANRMNLAAQAMNECFDQRLRIVLPEPEEGEVAMTTAHRDYVRETGSAALCSVPVEASNRLLGVWLLEREEPFEQDELDFLDTLALSVGPILELKRKADENLLRHVRRSWQTALRRVSDTSRLGLKLLALVVALGMAFVALYRTDYRVTSQAHVEGEIQRVAAAPFQGYIREAPARAGDVVREGQVLVKLEDKDLKLEEVRWASEMEVAQRKEQEAMANGDRVALRLASAQANQARAQLNLVQERLARVQVVAPFDGVVVHGDLSQKLGSPVEQGEVLFELAPLDAWRVILRVDERDIADVHEGKEGELVLTSLPGRVFPFRVKKVTPVSVAEEGHNYFRVEAALMQGAPKLRPGMEGVGKVGVAERSLLWIWTHRLSDWLRLTLWEWMP